MTVEKLYNNFFVLAQELAISEPYLSGFADYGNEAVKIQLYKADGGYYTVRFEGFGNRIEYKAHSTPELTVRKGALKSKQLKDLYEGSEKVLAAHHESIKKAERAEIEAKRLERIRVLEEELRLAKA